MRNRPLGKSATAQGLSKPRAMVVTTMSVVLSNVAIHFVADAMATFSELQAEWPWRPMPNCPGRFVLTSGPSRVAPEALAPDAAPTEHHVAGAADPVVVTRFVDGGLISYRKADGTYVHTLNTRDGLHRKLAQLGIE